MLQLPEWLYDRLQQPLPGLDAQLMLTPMGRREEIENLVIPADARKSSVLVLLYPGQDDWFFPLIQRPAYQGVHGGQIALPGGKMEPEDTSYIETALRESQEEIGIIPSKVEIIGQLSPIYIPPSRFWVQPVVGFVSEEPSFVPDAHEVEEILPTPAGIFQKEEIVKETTVTTSGGFRIRSKYYDIQNRIVWGATAMILSEFKVLTREYYQS